MNQFIQEASNRTTTENGAEAYKSTKSVIVDQFGLAGSYMDRPMKDVTEDQEKLWDENPLYALRFPFYLRMVTRKTCKPEGCLTDEVQRGQGLRDESFKRLIALEASHPKTFYANIVMLPYVGSWKDLWTLMYYSIKNEKPLNAEMIFAILKHGLDDMNTTNLVKKYMPRIKSNKKCTTERAKILNRLAKEFATFMGLNYAEYNKLKASGTAHDFQKIICAKKFDELNWNKIPGKALSLLVMSKFIPNHNLTDSYMEWAEKCGKMKFTGYAFELGQQVRKGKLAQHQVLTLNKQFDSLVATASSNNGAIKGNVWCALDTSGSMTWPIKGDITALDVCMSLGVFFSTLNTGAFHKNVIMFDSVSRVLQLEGDFVDMMRQIPSNAMGSTNFQSVVDTICSIRTNRPDIPLEDYPTTLLVVSDMQFNPKEHSYRDASSEQCDYAMKAYRSQLAKVFPQEWVDSFKFVWWNCVSRIANHQATIDDSGNYFFSGFDGSVISLLLGGNQKENTQLPDMEEIVDSALNQEVLTLLNITED